MVFLSSLEEWQKQSALLLQARPSTTKIVTKYNIPNLSSEKYKKKLEISAKRKDGATKAEEDKTLTPRGTITLRTYDPASGVVLQFKTDRAADVGRMIAGLGTMGRHMAALPPKAEVVDTIMEDAKPETAEKSAPAAESKPQTQTSGGGGKKKKKGKK